MNTGFQIPGRPSMGMTWLTYGLGSENKDLPGFVVLISGDSNPDGGKSCWGSGFLPTVYQGVEFRSQGEPVLFVSNPDGVSREVRRDTLDALHDLNDIESKTSLDPEVETRIAQYELGYRMQSSVPELMDISKEPQAIHDMYGTEPGKKSFANNCLLARRMVERGVRFVQLYHRGWDTHGADESSDIKHGLVKLCKETDQAAAALIKDLKQRGLLDDTIVVWGGEFGRTPMNEGRGGSPYPGRDHHPNAFTMWAAGGGIKPGASIGTTDDLGYAIASDPVDVHDLHATILHLMGIDHTRLDLQIPGSELPLNRCVRKRDAKTDGVMRRGVNWANMNSGRVLAGIFAVGPFGLLLANGLQSQPKVDFKHDVEPILSAHCFRCHSSDQKQGGLALDSSKAILAVTKWRCRVQAQKAP